MKNIVIKTAAVALLAFAPLVPAAYAGKGGSFEAVQAAVTSGSVDAIIAEVERTESLICMQCAQVIGGLTADDRYAVREVAAWWFARRPALRDAFVPQFTSDLARGDTTHVRNAADFLGASRTYSTIPQLRAAMHRSDIGSDAKLALVRAAGSVGQMGAYEILTTGMTDGDATVRAASVRVWRDMLNQTSAAPVVPLLADVDAHVRAQAASVVGGLHEQSGRAQLEALVVGDPDPFVRRNAAWALGQLGNAASRGALTLASGDKSPVVSGTARASLAQLH